MPKVWFRIALINFFIAAVMGAILRYAFVEEISWLKFRYFLHGHSHVAMLGWLYLGLYALLVHSFLPEVRQHSPFYRNNFIVAQASVVGMLIAFPIQGYGAWSIVFSTLHGLASYFFAYRFWKDMIKDGKASSRFVRTALLFMIFSTLALWAMPPIMLGGLQGKAIYYMTVQFYLHFQFNGWFIFAVLALFFKLLENHGISVATRPIFRFFWLLTVATLFTYALAVAWAEPLPAVFAINSLGVGLQLAALAFFAAIVMRSHQKIQEQLSGWGLLLIKIAFACFALTVLVQTAVIIPYIATVAYTIRNFVIGFIHLILLGIITQFVLGYGILNNLLSIRSSFTRMGLLLLLAGFFGSELLLFLQGTLFWAALGFVPFYYEGLFCISALIPVGILMILLGRRRNAPNTIPPPYSAVR